MSGIRPLNDRVLVAPVLAEQFSTGGIQLSTREKTEPNQGIVVASFYGSCVLPGEHVIFEQGKHPTTKVHGREVYVLREANLLAVRES